MEDTDTRGEKAFQMASVMRHIEAIRVVKVGEKARSAATGELEPIRVDIEQHSKKEANRRLTP